MSAQHHKDRTCPICKQTRRAAAFLPHEMVRQSIVTLIQKDHPDWTADQMICLACLEEYRTKHVRQMLAEQTGELTALQQDVVQSMAKQEVVTQNINALFETRQTLGQRVADAVASFGGSWTFILLFAGVLLLWIILNTVILLTGAFDPYPFILLNLVLSCLAAIQAPVIMMSQNRQEQRDRLRGEDDYRVNLKAELEIRHLNAKMDLLLAHQWNRLMEIQEIQMELMEDLVRKKA